MCISILLTLDYILKNGYSVNKVWQTAGEIQSGEYFDATSLVPT